MDKEGIKKLVEESKSNLEREFSSCEGSVRDGLKSFKKQTLAGI